MRVRVSASHTLEVEVPATHWRWSTRSPRGSCPGELGCWSHPRHRMGHVPVHRCYNSCLPDCGSRIDSPRVVPHGPHLVLRESGAPSRRHASRATALQHDCNDEQRYERRTSCSRAAKLAHATCLRCSRPDGRPPRVVPSVRSGHPGSDIDSHCLPPRQPGKSSRNEMALFLNIFALIPQTLRLRKPRDGAAGRGGSRP
jgi:hypothetical protein